MNLFTALRGGTPNYRGERIMDTRTVAFAAIAISLLIGCAGLGYAYYSGSTEVEDNTVDVNFSTLYVSDSTGDTKYSPSVLLQGIPSSVTSGETFDAASPEGKSYYITYRDTAELSGESASFSSGEVEGNRLIIAIASSISGLEDLENSTITIKIGGSSATAVIMNGECEIVGNSFSTTEKERTTSDYTRSTFTGRIHILITPYTSGTVNTSSAKITMTANHTELVAQGKLSVTGFETEGSDGSYSSKTDLKYYANPSTGSDMAVLSISAVYNESWNGNTVSICVIDKLRGTSVTVTTVVEFVDSEYKWVAEIPFRLMSGMFSGNLEIISIGDPTDPSPHDLDGHGTPASITLKVLETTETEVS